MVAASARILPVLVDCSAKGTHEDLKEKYSCRGFPTIVYIDPTGKKVDEMQGRDAKSVQRDFDGLAKKYPGTAPVLWKNSVKGAIAASKATKKPLPVAVVSLPESADIVKFSTRFSKDIGDRKAKFLWVATLGGDAPAIKVLDATAEDPAAAPVTTIDFKLEDKADVFTKPLDEALKGLKK